MAAKNLSIRKAGTRRGEPHYSLSCHLCLPGREYPLAIGYLSKDGAKAKGEAHLAERHA